MFNIDTSTSVDGKFVDGNHSEGRKGTQVSADWLNMVQAEMKSCLDEVNLQPNKEDNSQLLQALKLVMEKHLETIHESFALEESVSETSNAYKLCPVSITIPKGKFLDVTLSFRLISETDSSRVWVALTSSPDTPIIGKTIVNKDHNGNSRTTIRLITPKASAAMQVKIYGLWGGSEGQFFDIEGSYRIGF